MEHYDIMIFRVTISQMLQGVCDLELRYLYSLARCQSAKYFVGELMITSQLYSALNKLTDL
jgi:hypothetical protein